MALRLWLHRIYIPIQLEALWILIWIASVVSDSTFIKNQPKNTDSTFVPDHQIGDFNIVNSSLFTKALAESDDFVFSQSKAVDQDDDKFDDFKSLDGQDKQKHDNTSLLNVRDTFINPKAFPSQENKQNLDGSGDNDKQKSFKTREQKRIPGYHFLISNGSVSTSKIENKDTFHFKLNNVTLVNDTHSDGQSKLVNSSANALDANKHSVENVSFNKSVTNDKPSKTNVSDTTFFNKYLIAERKKAASHKNSTLPVSKQKILYHETSLNESSLMNDQPIQVNTSDDATELIKPSDKDEDDHLELNDHNNITIIDEAINETIYNDSSSAIGHIMPANSGLDFNTIVITGISLGVVILGGITAAGSYVIYRHRYWNKPQTLSDKCSNADSSGYIDDSTLRENSEEMYSLDNDSFLNSLEAMTIQNYWTDNVKHTKL